MIDMLFPGEWSDYDGRNSASRPPPVNFRRIHMIEEASKLIISQDNQSILSIGPVEYVIDQIDGRLL